MHLSTYIWRYLIFLSFFFQFQNGIAQTATIDSLNNILPFLRDTARIDCLNELGKYYCNYLGKSTYSRTDSASLCVNKAYVEAMAINDKSGIANAFVNFAEINIVRNNFVVAQNYAEKAISLFKEIKDEHRLGHAYMTLADALWYEGEITTEQNNLELALKYFKKVRDTLNQSLALDWQSECYLWKGDFEKGYECLQEQINLVKNLSKPEDILNALNRKQQLYDMAGWEDSVASYATRIIAYKEKIGIDTGVSEGSQYFIQHKWDSAEIYNRQLYNLIKSNNGIDSFVKASKILRNEIDEASIYQMEGKYEEALPIFLKALEYDKEKNLVWGELELLLNISQVYQSQGKNRDAIYYGQNLIALSEKTEANYYMLQASKLLWEIYDKKKDAGNAYKYYLKYRVVKDSTISGTYQRKLAVINELANEKEQQAQIAILDKENKIKEDAIHQNVLIRNALLAGVFILILFVLIIYRVIDLKRKNEKLEKDRLQHSLEIEHVENEKKQLELQNKATKLETQALRAQMNPHFIFNCLNSINRFIIKNDAAKAADYLTKFAKLIRIVLEQSGKSFVPLQDELRCLKLYMDLEALRFETPFQYEINCDGIDTSSVMIPTLLIQPFVENAIWHGLQTKTDGNGQINISIQHYDDILYCKICDNGIGRSSVIKEQTDIGKKSLGINLTEHRLQLIDPLRKEKAGIEVQDIINESGYNTGTCVEIKIPVKLI